ncbi:MAG: PH domain-containing protein [Ruminococcaceae bacterium]|nr:PH domain-containing protein [Oscillospiraceae bacterium]
MAKKQNNIEILWQDRKRFMGMPISFTKYKLSKDRLFMETGLISTKYEEIVLYRVLDISLKRNLWQKLFGVGTVTVKSSDSTCPVLEIKNIKASFDTKELLHSQVEEVKKDRRMRVSEIIGDDDSDGDGIPDLIDDND